MILFTICQDLIICSKALITEPQQTAFHIFKYLTLGIDDLRRPCYEVLEIGVYSTEFVDCIVVQLVLPGREQYRRVIFVWG